VLVLLGLAAASISASERQDAAQVAPTVAVPQSVPDEFVGALNSFDLDRAAELYGLTDSRSRRIIEDLAVVGLGEWVLMERGPSPDGGKRLTIVRGSSLRYSVAIGPPGPSARLTVQRRAAENEAQFDSWVELSAEIEQFGFDRYGLVVSHLNENGRCSIVEHFGLMEQPLASVSKLFLTAEVAKLLDSDELSMDHEIVIRAELDSLPSGTWQELSDGSPQSVRSGIFAMLRHSDNTAADHFIDLIGQRELTDSAHRSGFSRSIPFLTTQQVFKLKWGLDAKVIGDAASGSTLSIANIEELLRSVELPSFTGGEQPSFPTTIGWIAELDAVCDWWATIRSSSSGSGALDFAPRRVVGTNGDLAFVKAGNEPGVWAMSLLIENESGAYVVTLSVSDTKRSVPRHLFEDLLNRSDVLVDQLNESASES